MCMFATITTTFSLFSHHLLHLRSLCLSARRPLFHLLCNFTRLPANDAWDPMCLPTIHFQPPTSPPPAILKRGETRREWGEQQENSSWDSAARSVVARAERMACCVGQRRYCVSDPFSPSLLSFLMSSIPPFKPRNLFILQKVSSGENFDWALH